MLTVEYTYEYVEGEAGPNFYWRGGPHDYLRLINDLHKLGDESGTKIYLETLGYIQLLGGIQVLTKSSHGGSTLCEIKKSFVVVDLDPSLWRQILEFFLRVSFYPSHSYVEFDDLELIEHANFIISSEA